MRHGERLDGFHIDSEEKKSYGEIDEIDVPISKKGKSQSYETGIHIAKKYLQENGIEKIRVMSSPYLRCVQTSSFIIDGILEILKIKRPPMEIKEELSEMLIGGLNDMGNIDNLKLNKKGFDELKISESVNKD